MSNFKIQRPKIHGFPETRMQKVKKLQEWKEIKRKYTYTVWSSKTSSSLQKTLFPTPKTNLYLATSRLARSTGQFRNPPSVWTKVRSRTMRSVHNISTLQDFNATVTQIGTLCLIIYFLTWTVVKAKWSCPWPYCWSEFVLDTLQKKCTYYKCGKKLGKIRRKIALHHLPATAHL